MGAQIPAIVEKPLATSGCRKFQLDPLGDHLNTCTAHSGAKKAHDWMVDQVADLFRTTHRVKTQQVVKSRGQRCADIQLEGYLAMKRVRCHWCWTSGLLTTEWGAVPTLLLTDT
jgi:hypothetical protein